MPRRQGGSEAAALRNDLDLYEREAASWWDPRSRFAASLHGVNALRLQEIADVVGRDLRGLHVADLGCGGGLVSVPLAQAGARVVGVDISPASLRAASGRGEANLRVLRADARQPALAGGWADLVVCADVVEHVDGWPRVLAAASTLLRPGGRMYLNTVNRTRRARWLAVGLAEGVGLVPRGTHDPQRFVTPDEIGAAAAACGLVVERFLGQRLRVWRTIVERRIRVAPGRSLALGYGAWLRKPVTTRPS